MQHIIEKKNYKTKLIVHVMVYKVSELNKYKFIL